MLYNSHLLIVSSLCNNVNRFLSFESCQESWITLFCFIMIKEIQFSCYEHVKRVNEQALSQLAVNSCNLNVQIVSIPGGALLAAVTLGPSYNV